MTSLLVRVVSAHANHVLFLSLRKKFLVERDMCKKAGGKTGIQFSSA